MSAETLEAGRDLDAQVAERVMGWRITHRGHRVTPGADFRSRSRASEMKGFTGLADARRWIAQVCPEYSTDITDAWLVVEKMREKGWAVVLDSLGYFGEEWRVMLDLDETDAEVPFFGEAATAPLAICLAALEATRTGEPPK